MIRERLRRSWPQILFFTAVFLGLQAFFTIAHPLVLFDSDDWSYFAAARPAIPMPNFWNPSRVLPELLMPLFGSLTALLTGLTGDYILTQIYTVGLMYTLFVFAYVFAFYRLMIKRLKLGRGSAMLLSLVFLLLHFLIFRSKDSGNLHLFFTPDVDCICFYAIPALLNAILVMLELSDGWLEALFRPGKLVLKGFLLLAVYLAVFSNLFGSVSLAVYAGCRFLAGLFGGLKRKERLSSVLRGELPRILLVLLWLAALANEGLGGRAAVTFGTHPDLMKRLADTFRELRVLLGQMNLLFLALMGTVFLYLLVMLLSRRTEEKREDLLRPVGLLLAGFLLCAVFVLLLCAVVEPAYVKEPETDMGVFFFVLLGMCWSMGFALRRRKRLALLLPLLVTLIWSCVNTNSLTFAEPNYMRISGKTVIQINYDLIGQVLDAQAEGKKAVTVKTLSSGEPYENWPHSTLRMGDALARALYKHRVVDDYIEITLEPSEEFNETYGLVFGTG